MKTKELKKIECGVNAEGVVQAVFGLDSQMTEDEVAGIKARMKSQRHSKYFDIKVRNRDSGPVARDLVAIFGFYSGHSHTSLACFLVLIQDHFKVNCRLDYSSFGKLSA